jgi:hypothetical protein
VEISREVVERCGAALALVWSEVSPLLGLKDDASIEPRLRRLLER